MQSAKEVQQAWNLLISKGLLNYLQFGEAGSSKSWLPIVGVFKTKVAFQRYELWNGLKTQPKAVVFQQVVKQTNMILSPIPDYISRFHARDFFSCGTETRHFVAASLWLRRVSDCEDSFGINWRRGHEASEERPSIFFCQESCPGLRQQLGHLGKRFWVKFWIFFWFFVFFWNILEYPCC